MKTKLLLIFHKSQLSDGFLDFYYFQSFLTFYFSRFFGVLFIVNLATFLRAWS